MKSKFISIVSVVGFLASAVSEYGFDLDFPLAPARWLVVTLFTVWATSVRGAPNSWINTASGTWAWGTAGNWSLAAAPSINQSGIFITNVVNDPLFRLRFVLIDNTTPAGAMTISNLTIANVGPLGGTQNKLLLQNAGSTEFHIYGVLSISNSASVSITNSVLRVENPGPLQNDFVVVNGSLTLNTGSLISSGATAFVIGDFGNGQMTVQDGRWLAPDVTVGGFGSGTLTLVGGTNLFGGALVVGAESISTSTVSIAGGEVTATNGITKVSQFGVGQMSISGGTARFKEVEIEEVGTLTIAGGTTSISSNLLMGIADRECATWMTGGILAIAGLVDLRGPAQMTVSNGVFAVNEIVLRNDGGFPAAAPSSLTIAGGTVSVYSNLTLGFDCFATNTVSLTGGSLYVTNAAHNASLNITRGDFIQTGGTIVADQLIVYTPCGQLLRYGGSLSAGLTNIDPNASSVGDGIPNSWKAQYRFDPFDPNLATKDADGDGQNNLAEYLSGTNPTNSGSALRIISVVPQGDDVRLRWTSAGGHTNAIEATDGTTNGSFTNDFDDLIWYFMSGGGDVTNQFLDFGGATNRPSRFYRVRLVP